MIQPPLQPPKWTQEEAIAFEAARECIGEVMAICSAEIFQEEQKAAPDPARIASLEAELAALAKERASLRVHEADNIATVRAIYGARIRAYRSQQG